MKAIIFGSNGQDGIYLSALLQNLKIEVIGISRSGQTTIGNVADYDFVKKTISHLQPDYIFHLAANSTTKHDALFENNATIGGGTFHILEAVRIYCPHCKVFISGSAMQFQNKGIAIDESTPFEASSPYAISRIQSLYACRYYRDKFGMNIYFGYFFNHDSPYRSEQHVNQKIVQAAKRMAAGSKEMLELGNISVKKEFNFAGDIVKAIWLLINNNHIFEAVIGSGKAYSIENWLDVCFEPLSINWRDRVKINSNYKAEYNILVSNPERIFSLGWKPEVEMAELANMMLNFKY